MNLGPLILISFSVGLDNAAVGVAIGLSCASRHARLKIALTFGFFESLMPLIGLLVGSGLAHDVGALGRYAGALLLILTGLYAYWQSWPTRRQPGAKRGPVLAGPQLLITACALCIDNLIVGFALSMTGTPLPLAAATMIATSLGMTLLALELGHQLGRHIEHCGDEIGAAVLILVGVALATGILG